MPVLADPKTITGPLTAADLEAARRDNPGSIWHPHRHIMPAGLDQQGRYQTRQWGEFPDTVPTDFGAPEGGTFREPSAALQSMRRHSVIRYRVALALLVAVAAYLSHIAWPLVAA